MADKFLTQIDAKLDAILEKLGIKQEEIKARLYKEAPQVEMTEAEKQAVANAPATPAADVPPAPATGTEETPVTPATPSTERIQEEGPAVPRRRS